MTFENNGHKMTVTDPAHIDCLIAKGWTVVEEVKTTEVKKKTSKKA